MARSADCQEHLLLELFWPFMEKLGSDPILKQWKECPFATTAAEIAMAEKALWYRFPEPYRLFLLGWNGFCVTGERRVSAAISFFCCTNFLTDEHPAQKDSPQWCDIVRGNSTRFKWPEQPGNMVDFARDEHGNAYGFVDTHAPESPVMYWDHDGCETTRLADNFAAWLNELPQTLARP